MATPNTLRNLIGKKTPYRWLTEELEKHHSISKVATANEVSSSAIYQLIKDENLIIVQRILKNPTNTKLEA